MDEAINNPPRALEFHNVSVAYNDALVLTDVDFTIPCGALVGVLGPNGAGKSTLLKTAVGLVAPCSGWIEIFGKDPSLSRTKIAYVPQRESVAWDFPATVLDVVHMGMFHEMQWWQPLGKERKQRALSALEQMGMIEMRERPLAQLSGGQQQRVFLARAIVQRPKMLFLDEPLAGIDVDTEAVVIETLKQLCAKDGATALVVHHDLSRVESYFDHVVMVNARLIVSGQTQTAFTPDAIKTTYGPRSSLHELARRSARPINNYSRNPERNV